MGIIDTGADVSLISDEFVDKFKNKLKDYYCEIKGITDGILESKYSFITDFEITGQKTKLNFLVVPPETLDYDVIIGCELFNDNTIQAVTNYEGTKIIRKQLPGVLRITEEISNKIDVSEEYFAKIQNLIKKYPALTDKQNINEVKNATLEINLTDNYIVKKFGK